MAAARLLGVTQPDVSDLVRGRLGGFSLERLCRFVDVLGLDVYVLVRPKPASRKVVTARHGIRHFHKLIT
jgi:predicted XRE-type DNA-binding protein